jgi:hypothetical protein
LRQFRDATGLRRPPLANGHSILRIEPGIQEQQFIGTTFVIRSGAMRWTKNAPWVARRIRRIRVKRRKRLQTAAEP